MTNSRQKGKRGEREAAKYLASLGFGTYGDDTHVAAITASSTATLYVTPGRGL